LTQAEIRTRVRQRLDEDAATSQRYPDSLLDEFIADGVRFYVARVGNQYAETTITQSANTLFHHLPCDCIAVERVLWNNDGEYVPLEPTGHRALDGDWYKWQRQTDTRSRAYFVFGLDRIALWPEVATAGEEYRVVYKQDVYDAVSRVPVEDHQELVGYVVARCLLAEGKAEDGANEYAKWRMSVERAAQRRSSADRQWGVR